MHSRVRNPGSDGCASIGTLTLVDLAGTEKDWSDLTCSTFFHFRFAMIWLEQSRSTRIPQRRAESARGC